MIVMGFDPSVRQVGYAVLRYQWPAEVELLELGHWNLLKDTNKDLSLGSRLEILHGKASELIKKWNPRWVGIERAVMFRNPQSALKLSEARGILRLACYQNLADMDARLIELSPTAIKKSTAAWGRSSKADMLAALKLRFSNLKAFDEAFELDHDAYDALGVAWSLWIQLRQFERTQLVLDKGV